jgi:quercetin dioxygenase-like cupin family protein
MQFLQLSSGLGFQMGKGDSRRVVAPEMGAGEITLNYSVFEPGQEFPQHRHDYSEDCFVVLRGGGSVREGDRYTPIRAGDAVWIPVADVHGTVNTTHQQAILMSFQSPPDGALYRGERDSSHGPPPAPPPGAASRVQIRHMPDVAPEPGAAAGDGVTRRRVVSRATGAEHMEVDRIEVAPRARLSLPATGREQVVVVIEGEAQATTDGAPKLTTGGVVFLEPDDALSLQAGGAGAVLVRAASITRAEK